MQVKERLDNRIDIERKQLKLFDQTFIKIDVQVRRQTQLPRLVIVEGQLQVIGLVKQIRSRDFNALPKLIDLHDVDQLVVVKGDESFEGSLLQIEIVLSVSDSLNLLKQASITVNTTGSGK